MESVIKSISLIALLLVWICIFIAMGYGFGYDSCENDIKNDLKEWAIEQNYMEYNSKTGNIEIVDKDIEPISKYILNEKD